MHRPLIILSVIAFLLTPFMGLSQETETDYIFDERDGSIYLSLKFHEQWWMCQNLKFVTESGSGCYDDDETNCMLKGRWYTWEAAKKACPEGWRLPTDEDWKKLEKYIGMDASDLDERYNRNSGTVGKFLKSGGGLGFDAEFAGLRNPNAGDNYFNTQACFWTSTEFDVSNAWSRILDKDKEGIDRKIMPKNFSLSIRCVKDAEKTEAPEEEKEKED